MSNSALRSLLSAVGLSATLLASAQSFGNAGFQSPPVPDRTFRSGVDVPNFAAPWYGDHSFGIASGSGSYGTGGHESSQYAYVQSTNEFGGAGSIFQTLSGLTVGQNYSVTFWMARRNGNVGANVANAIAVYADSLAIMAATTPTSALWQAYTTGAFTATSDTMRITFQGQVPTSTRADTTSLIDDVGLNVAPVPEPSSWAALTLGLAACRRRRRR